MKNSKLVIVTGTILTALSCNSIVESDSGPGIASPVDFNHVELQDGFWKNWVELASSTTIPYAFHKCEETGRINNFIYAGGIKAGKFQGRYGFDDSDVYKIMEGASYSLMLEDDPEMEFYLDTLIHYISEAQEDDGYLYTSWTLKANEYNDFYCCSYSPEGQWTGSSGLSHELYNAGHMYEAAVAHHLATGKNSFLNIALANADLVHELCIVQGKNYMPGHQEIEIGLIKLYRVTGEQKYLDLAKHLLDKRADYTSGEYSQAHLPVTEQREAVGHAVRANYMYTAMADIAALTADSAYLHAIDQIWNNVVSKKLSVTGGVGATPKGEAYGENYDLPNHPYNETCAAIANVYWNHRMFLLHRDARYIDVLERALYNGVLSGLAMDGTHFFYPNTLRFDGVSEFNRGEGARSPWFNCSCCPSNLSRFIPSVGGYAYGISGRNVYVNLYMNSTSKISTTGGILEIAQTSDYPWDGTIRLELLNADKVKARLHIRIPGWIRDQVVPSDLFSFTGKQQSLAGISVNGENADMNPENGYVILDRNWKKGDVIEINLPMEVKVIRAHPEVQAKSGLRAVQFGPLVYCAEEADNVNDVLSTPLEDGSAYRAEFHPEILGGVNMLSGTDLKLVPYYAWANRGSGKMNVWFPQAD